MKKSLTIAGSDSSCGAGIQTDLKTFVAHGVYPLTAITAITAQNTVGVSHIEELSMESIKLQIEAVVNDIGADSVKIGMLSNKETILTVSRALKELNLKNIVLDPVMVSTTGHKLIKDDAINTLIEQLFPIADIITPNIKEAELLVGFEIKNEESMEKAAKKLREYTKGDILIKGGHLDKEDALDIFYSDGNIHSFISKRVDSSNTHGTGCTLSSAIAANLANGKSKVEAVRDAKDFITSAIESGIDIGKGAGPTNPLFFLKPYSPEKISKEDSFMKETDEFYDLIESLRGKKPLIHHITNSVTINDCANITLAIGGSPVMADDINEVEEMASIASALVINVGTLNSRTIESMIKAGKMANKMGIPVILDPVGAGATSLRKNTLKNLLREVRFAVIKGNSSEIMSLIEEDKKGRGVDSLHKSTEALSIAKELAKKYSSVIAVSGDVDIVTDGDRVAKIKNGTSMMGDVTGTGCMGASLIASFCSISKSNFEGAVLGLLSIGIAGEMAESSLRNNEGIGTFKVRMMDYVHSIDSRILKTKGKVEYV